MISSIAATALNQNILIMKASSFSFLLVTFFVVFLAIDLANIAQLFSMEAGFPQLITIK